MDLLTARDFLYLTMVFAYTASTLLAFCVGLILGSVWRKKDEDETKG